MADMSGWPTEGAEGAVSSEARWRAMARLWAPSGVVGGYLGDLAPSLAAGSITVQAGAAWIDGHYAEILTSTTFTSTTTGLVVARFTPANNHFELIYRDGATTPTQTDATWELPIARITSSALYDTRNVLGPGGSSTQRIGHIRLTAAGSIDFSGIPTSYNHLRLVGALRASGASAAVVSNLRFNGDSGTMYDSQTVRGNEANTSAAHQVSDTGIRFAVPGATAWGANYAPITVDIPNYRGSGMRRLALVTYGWNSSDVTGGGTNDLKVETVFGQWRNTAAITSITLSPTMDIGSVATLYGLM